MASIASMELSGFEGTEARLADVARYSLAELRQTPLPWDRVVKASHLTACAWQMACNFNLFVKDGLVLREEQAGIYPPRNDPAIPDLNPRGCQKGVCYAHRIYDPTRIKYPLKRVGARGEGRWQRVTWDEALGEIADTLLDVLVNDGPDAILEAAGNRIIGTHQFMGLVAFFGALGAPLPVTVPEIGDHWPGVALTFGKMFIGDSGDNWFYADLILVWGGNPAFTHMPNFHYIAEARYHGTRVIVISPDQNASAIHADEWVPVNVGSDAALALSMAQVILEEGLYKGGFIREQTDLPLLVRRDNQRFLRECDLKQGGREDLFYCWDLRRGELAEAPRHTLALGGVEPALEGEYWVDTLGGKVRVVPVMELLKRHLDQGYTPEQASRVSGVPAARIRDLARKIARARGVVNTTTSVWGRFYHGDLIERAMILVFALCGHIGRKGASYNAFPVLAPDTAIAGLLQRGDQSLRAAAAADPRYAGWREQGYTDEMILYEYARDAYAQGALMPSSLVFPTHSGLLDLAMKHNNWDPHLKRPLADYIKESTDKGWHFASPVFQKEPRVLFAITGDLLRRVRGTNHLLTTLLPKLRLVVSFDWRMGVTGMYSDFILPVASWYEATSTFMISRPVTPYLHMSNRAAEPLYEVKSQWDVFVLLARKMEERARERGLVGYTDRQGNERRLDRLVDRVTAGGLYLEGDEEAIARDAFANATNVEAVGWEEFSEKGIAALTGIGDVVSPLGSAGNQCDLAPGEAMVPLTWHTEKKQPYPTLTRRIQFYIDHDWFLELGEALPAHKDPPSSGGDYPLRLTGGHARWSLHSDLVDDVILMRLQRGGPVMFISPADARERGIEDGERAEVWNDVGAFAVRAVVTPAIRPGQVVIYHSWANYQFNGWRHFKSVMPSPMNPIGLAGGYGHIRAKGDAFYPGCNDRETRVEVRKAGQT